MSDNYKTFAYVNKALQLGMIPSGNLFPQHFVRANNLKRAKSATQQYVQFLLDSDEVLKADAVLATLPVILQDDADLLDLAKRVRASMTHAWSYSEHCEVYSGYSTNHGGGLLDSGIVALGRYHLALPMLDSVRPKSVLNVGCGDGVFDDCVLSHLGEDLKAYTITDTPQAAHVAAALATKHSRLVGFHPCVAHLHDWPEAQYDAVVALEIIEHVADQLLFAQELAERVRPGGHLILSTPDASIWVLPQATTGEMVHHLTANTEFTLRRTLTNVGLTDIEIVVSAEGHLVSKSKKAV